MKMKKVIPAILAFFLVISTFLPSITFAAETPLWDGEYTIEFTVLKNGTNDASVMDGYTEKPAILYVENGKKTVHLTLKNSDWIKVFQVAENGVFVDAKVVSEDTAADKRVVEFQVENLNEKLNAFAHVVIPMLDYDSEYTVQFEFDLNSLVEVNVEKPNTGDSDSGDSGAEDPVNEEPGTEEPGNDESGSENPGSEEPGTDEPTEPGEPEEPSAPEQPEAIADGAYTIDLQVLKNGTNDASVMDGYVVKDNETDKPKLIVENGEKLVQLTFKNSSWIKVFKVEENGNLVVARVVSEDTAADKRVVEFQVENLNEKLNAFTHVVIPMLNYDNEYTVQISFDPNSLAPVTVEEPGNGDPDTETPGSEEPGNENPGTEEPEVPNLPINLEEGKYYTIDYSAIRAENDDISSMDIRFEKPATLITRDNKYYLSFSMTEAGKEHVTGLEMEKSDGTWHSANSDFEIIELEVASLHEPINGKVSMEVPLQNGEIYKNTQSFRVAFDVTTIAEFTHEEPGAGEPTEPGEPEEPSAPEQPEAIADGAYTIDLQILKNGTNDASVMDGYVVKDNDADKPKLIVENGEKLIQLTFKNSSWIKVFKVEENGNLVDARVVSEDTEADKRVVEFRVEDLHEKLNAFTHVVIPMLNYDNEYTVQISFDLNSLVPVTVEEPGIGEPEEPGAGEPTEPGTPEQPIGIADGTYPIEFKIFKNGATDTSVMDGYTQKPATLHVKNGEATIHLTFSNSSWIKLFQVKENGVFKDATVVRENKAEDTRVVAFKVDNLDEKVEAYTHVVIPAINYDNYYTVQIKFDAPTLPVTPSDELDVVLEMNGNVGTVSLTNITKPTKINTTYNGNPISIVVPAGSDQLTISRLYKDSASLEIDIKVGKLGNKKVILTLPKPAGLSANKVGAFHKNGNVWEYRAATVQGNEVTFETDLSTVKLAEKVDVPTNLRARVSGSNITLSWNGVTGASYELIREVNGTETVIKNINQTSYTDTGSANNQYSYQVRAVKNNHHSNLSNEVTATVAATTDSSSGSGSSRSSRSSSSGDIEDGDYSIDFRVLKNGANNRSIMSDYVETPAKLEVSNGRYYVTVTLTNSSWIKVFDVTDNGGRAKVVSSDKDEDIRDVRFEVYDLDEKIGVYTEVLIPHLNYDGKYDVQFLFDKSSISSSKKTTKKEKEKDEKRKDGDYTIDFKVLKNGTNQKSMMADYVETPAKLEVSNGKHYVTITLKNSSWIKEFKVTGNGGKATVVSTDKDADTREVRFEINDLSKKVEVYTEVVILHLNYDGKYDVQFIFDEDSIKTSTKEKNDKDEDGKDGDYTIDFQIFKNGTTQQSVMADYVAKPAKLTIENGKNYITLTLKNSSWQKVFEVKGNGGSTTVVSTDKDADTRDVRFEVYDLSKKVEVYTEVLIPDINYDGKYDVQFLFDEDSITPVESKADKTTATVSVSLTDINGHWAEQQIKEMVAAGVVTGYPNGAFKPNQKVTRAEFATMLVKAFNLDTNAQREFTDTKNHWAKDNIAIAASYRIVLGYEDGSFRPDEFITREQMVVMIVRAANLQSANNSLQFADRNKISTWAKEAVTIAISNKIITGYPDNTFKPNGNSTRAEAVTVIYKALDL